MKHLKFLAALCCVAVMFAACETNRLDDGGPGAETEGSEQIGNYYAVDLGLPSGLKWATCNVGATKPEEYGNYYAWGETSTKSHYTCSTYKWATVTQSGRLETFTKYNTSSDYGTVDNKTTLELADDAARANWGGAWRMPTYAEWMELEENCTWTWTTLNGKNGYKVKGANGNSIFLPAAGHRDYDVLVNAGGDYYYGQGYYWSSSLYTDNPHYVWYVDFCPNDVGWSPDYGYDTDRCRGLPVRPVLGE